MTNGQGQILWRTALGEWTRNDPLFDAKFIEKFGNRPWPIDTSLDRAPAHALHVELISRITTQPLGYTEGSEASALESVFSLFAAARDLTKRFENASTFETVVWHVMNTFVRPFTAKWHVKATSGELRALDSSDVFRAELLVVQKRLIALDAVLAKIGGGAWISLDTPVRPLEVAILAEMKDKKASWKPMGEPSSVAVARPRTKEDVETLKALHDAEKACVKKRREFYNIVDEEWASGIALSGGGIRSATFAMGVLVSLSKRNLLTQFDYLSTVSGGGYTGSFLTQLIGAQDTALSLDSSDLPFKREEGESLLLQRIRHGASFLSAGPWERFSVGMAQSQGIFVNLVLMIVVISLFAGLQIILTAILNPAITAFLALLFTGALLIWAVVAPIQTRKNDSQTPGKLSYFNSYVSASLLVLPLWGVLQAANVLTTLLATRIVPNSEPLIAYAMILLLSLLALFAVGTPVFVGFSRIRPPLMTILTVLFVFLCEEFIYQILNSLDAYSAYLVVSTLAAIGMVLFTKLNVNATSLHHYYRHKLARAFLLDGKLETPRPMKLSEFNPERATFPIINCALNVPGSKMPEMRGRQADLFSMTPVSAGANVIGHSPMTAWETANPDLDLATAMALSGAAVSPQMGLRTNRNSSFWMTLLNLRLNLWLRCPSKNEPKADFPNFMNLQQELLASADEKGEFVNISDGGHIENLGVYELLRRRCRFIVAVDGENDSQMTFHALTNLQRLAYIDHGIIIDADLEDLRLGDRGLSRSHFRFCRIRYPSGAGDRAEEIGYLVYLKLSLTGNEGEFIRRYKFDEPAFPHHPTANQFFTEVQFEAYRALGEHVGDKMFLHALTGFADDLKDVLLEDWFYGLGKSFLDSSTTLAELNFCFESAVDSADIGSVLSV